MEILEPKIRFKLDLKEPDEVDYISIKSMYQYNNTIE